MSSAMPDSSNDQDSVFHTSIPATARPMPAATDKDCRAVNTADWDSLFDVVAVRLRRTVGEDLQNPPDVPLQSAALTAGMIQAVVLIAWAR